MRKIMHSLSYGDTDTVNSISYLSPIQNGEKRKRIVYTIKRDFVFWRLNFLSAMFGTQLVMSCAAQGNNALFTIDSFLNILAQIQFTRELTIASIQLRLCDSNSYEKKIGQCSILEENTKALNGLRYGTTSTYIFIYIHIYIHIYTYNTRTVCSYMYVYIIRNMYNAVYIQAFIDRRSICTSSQSCN